MPKASSPKQKIVAQFRQSEILEAARRVFARKGFDAALVDDIAAEAEIAKGTVYLYFKSKADIYQAALREDLLALAKIKRERMEAATGLREKLLAFLTATIEFCDERRDFLRIFLLESGKLACAALSSPKEIHAHKAEQLKLLAGVFAEHAKRGEIRQVPNERAATLIGDAMRGIIERRVLQEQNPSAEEEARIMLDLLWNGLKPEEGSPGRRKL